MLFCYFRYVCSREKSKADMQMVLLNGNIKMQLTILSCIVGIAK